MSQIRVNTIQNANGTTGITFAANGQVTLANTPLQLTGGQIVFPGTQIASADANTLDDYEEGNWTSTVTSSGGTITTHTVNRAFYVKIGITVYFNIDITISVVGTASGALRFTLPFTTTSVNSIYGREYNALGYGFLGAMDGVSVNAYAYAATSNNGNAFAAGNGMRANINGFFQV